MKSIHSYASIRLLVCFLLIVSLCSLFGCIIPPAFPGGVRVTTIQLFQGGLFPAPAPGVEDAGNAIQTLGGGSGTALTFDGITNQFGIDDHPDAITNSVWNVEVFWGGLVPQCPPDSRTVNVPLEGEIAHFECQM